MILEGQADPAPAISIDNATRVIEAIRTTGPTPSAKAITGCILVVDDKDSKRDLLARQPTRDSHAVETAASAAEAFAGLNERSFDLILLSRLITASILWNWTSASMVAITVSAAAGMKAATSLPRTVRCQERRSAGGESFRAPVMSVPGKAVWVG